MRHKNCYQRLHNLWLNKQHEPFVWGKHDCLVLAILAIEAITNRRYPFCKAHTAYDSAKSACRLLAKQSLEQHASNALKPFFPTSTNEHNLQSGDIALIKSSYTKGRSALAVLDLCSCGFVLPAFPSGIMRIARKNVTIIKSWSIN